MLADLGVTDGWSRDVADGRSGRIRIRAKDGFVYGKILRHSSDSRPGADQLDTRACIARGVGGVILAEEFDGLRSVARGAATCSITLFEPLA